MNLAFLPRAAQARILEYSGGKLGVAAVPGSGKTHTLSALAARLIAQRRLQPGQEILIVTLVNSAVDNFSARVEAFARDLGLVPRLGYRVRTLHGLAHDIVRENPAMAGLDTQFSIVDEVAATAVLHDVARSWAQASAGTRDGYIKEELGEQARHQVLNNQWPDLIETVAASFIRAAKDRRASPFTLRQALDPMRLDLPLARMGTEIYGAYQNVLAQRGAVDFDDLIRLAADMLERSSELVERLRHRWPIILEDEAQDSSALQEWILSTLTGPQGNWIRVGDPNQAIFETFTTADPSLLLNFIRKNPNVPMPHSGRCQPSVIRLANYLVEWTVSEHPIDAVRSALSRAEIRPAPPGDPQPNPPDQPSAIEFVLRQLTPQQEIQATVASIQSWLPSHLDSTVAVLSATNDHAAKMVKALQERGIRCLELLRSTTPTRTVAGALSHVLSALADPGSSRKLSKAYRVWRRDWRGNPQQEWLIARVAGHLDRVKHVEELLALGHAGEALGRHPSGQNSPASAPVVSAEEAATILSELQLFRRTLDRWHRATALPIAQLLLTLAQDIFTDSADLALAHKLALVMGQLASENRRWRLLELTPHLNLIARNQRKFIGFSNDDLGFQPDEHRGVVVVATMHKAKGLEWDRVHLLSVNDYDFPSSQERDTYMSEKWFIRDGLNLEAESLAQMKTALTWSGSTQYQEGAATKRARVEYARERLRLLYVGITRARRELIVSWNTGRRGTAGPALALFALQEWYERTNLQAPPAAV